MSTPDAPTPAGDPARLFTDLYAAVAACEAPEGTQVDDVLADFAPAYALATYGTTTPPDATRAPELDDTGVIRAAAHAYLMGDDDRDLAALADALGIPHADVPALTQAHP